MGAGGSGDHKSTANTCGETETMVGMGIELDGASQQVTGDERMGRMIPTTLLVHMAMLANRHC